MNPYKLLGASRPSSDQEIKALFRSRCQQSHPDKGGSLDEFMQLQEAFDLISTEKARRALDKVFRLDNTLAPCPSCSGKGIRWVRKSLRQPPREEFCSACEGSGYTKKEASCQSRRR